MAVITLFCALCSISCASVQTDIRYSGGAGSAREKVLETLEATIVSQRIQYNPEQLKRTQADIEATLREPSTDSSYLARLHALSADVYLLQRQPNEARKQLAAAKQQNEYDEYVQLVSARLISDPEKRRAYLEERLVQNPTYYRLKAELGGLYFAAQDYRNALAAFDASLSFLPEGYRQLYGKQREQSLQLYTIDGAPIRKSSEKILQTPQLSLVEMATLTQDSTNALDFITGTAEWKPPLLAEYLQKDGWYHPERNVLKDLASKKDAALFLWHLIVGNDESRLKRYTRYYTSKRRLPIPDVMMDGVYFDAIVGTVEEDVVPLTDGKNFEPNKPVSGMEFYRWLLKADALR
jgi:tetratricopeptide repeat domain protein